MQFSSSLLNICSFESLFLPITMDDFTQTAPALGALLQTLFTVFLISGVACELYGLVDTVCLCGNKSATR